MPVKTRSMTKATQAAEASYFDGIYRRISTRQAEKKVAAILVEMSTGSLSKKDPKK